MRYDNIFSTPIILLTEVALGLSFHIYKGRHVLKSLKIRARQNCTGQQRVCLLLVILSIILADKADELEDMTPADLQLFVRAGGVFTLKGFGYDLPLRHVLTGSLCHRHSSEERMTDR